MSDPKLREARIARAKEMADLERGPGKHPTWTDSYTHHLLDLIQADWRPEPEVDAVTLAAREWMVGNGSITTAAYIHDGNADQSTFADAFRAGHAHALANCADVKRMDWLGMRDITVHPGGGKDLGFGHFLGGPNDPLRAKIDRAMEGGE